MGSILLVLLCWCDVALVVHCAETQRGFLCLERDETLVSRDRQWLIEAIRAASFAINQAHLIAAELTSWRETASALAAGMRNSPVDWLDDEIPVARP